LIREARDLGVYLFFILGGEPLLRDDMLDQIAEAKGAFFLVFTNGLLLDESKASAISHCKNVLLLLSLEGFRESTDRWRGPGVFDALMEKMALLSRQGVLFGYSATVTNLNHEEVSSERFVRAMREAGCRVAFHSGYIAVGEQAPREFQLTPQERQEFKGRVKELAQVCDVAFISENLDPDFCLGGSEFLHISPYGDAEPCPAIHFSTHNVRQHSLVEIVKSRLMQEMRNTAQSLSGSEEMCVCRSGEHRRLCIQT
jgi:MoaA/NifB/PqqE/SkfB family radical SAM enzyme